MTNREKFAEQILDIACAGNRIAVTIDGKVVNCAIINCEDCKFNSGDCNNEIKGWSEQEYIEPSIDWSKVAVDTPILVKEGKDEKWMRRYFSKFECGSVCAWNNGATSWSTSFDTPWEYAKLAEDVRK